MQFSRDDLGALFNDNSTESRIPLFASANAIPKSSVSVKPTTLHPRSLPSSSSTTATTNKPTRYWPGQIPQHQYTKNNDDDDEDEEEEGQVSSHLHSSLSSAPTDVSNYDQFAYAHVLQTTIPSRIASSTASTFASSSSLSNPANANPNDEPDIPRPTAASRRREYFVAEVISAVPSSSTAVPSSVSSSGITTTSTNETTLSLPSHSSSSSVIIDKPVEETEEEIAARRARIRERLRARKQEEQSTDTTTTTTIASNVPVSLIVPLSTSQPRRPIEAAVVTTATPSTVTPSTVIPSVTSATLPLKEPLSSLPSNSSAMNQETDGSDEDEDEEDDEPNATASTAWSYGRPMFRPVFRGKHERSTLIEAETKAKEEQSAFEAQAKLNAERAEESRRMVAQALKAEEAIAAAEREAEDDRARPDDTDKVEDEEKDFEEWRLRELHRIKRDMEAEAKIVAEIAETERRRKLTPEERRKEDKDLEAQGLKVFHKDKTNAGERRGAFFSDETLPVVRSSTATSTAVTQPTNPQQSSHPTALQAKQLEQKGKPRYQDTSVDPYYRDASRLLPQAARERLEYSRGGNKNNF